MLKLVVLILILVVQKNRNLNAKEGLGTRGFVFKGGSTMPLSMDETKIADEMTKLNLEHSGSGESVGKNKDIDDNLSADDKAWFGPGMSDNVHSSIGKYVASKLPIEFRKLNVKSTQVLDGSDLINADVKKQSVFKSSTTNSVFSAGTSETVLQDQMKKLNVKDSVNANGFKKNMFDSKSSLETKFTFGSDTATMDSSRMKTDEKMSDMMGNMKIESEKGNSSIQTGRFSSFPGIYNNSKKTGSLSDERLNNGGGSIPTGFIFEAAIPVKDTYFQSSENIPEPPISNVPGKKDEFHFTTKQDGAGTSHSAFNAPNAKGNVFSRLNQKSDITERRVHANNIRSKKGMGQSRQHNPVHVWLGPNSATSGSISSQESSVSPMAYSPMDVSPYKVILADNRSRETSVASDDSFIFDESSDTLPTASNDAMDKDLASATQRMNISEGVEKSEEEKEGSSEYHFERNVSSEVHEEESIYSAKTESFKTVNEDLDDEASVSSSESQESDKLQFISTRSQATSGTSFVFMSSSSAQGQASSGARQHKKKNRLSVGIDSASSTTLSGKSHHSSSPVQFPFSGVSSIFPPRYSHTEDASTLQHRRNEFEMNKEQEAKQGPTSTSATAVAAQEACEKWRLRGNQSYSNGDLLKAEEYYTHGVGCISRSETSRSCLRALMLCYSNRAATRMSLGRMRDAVKDCMLAVAIDPSFLRVQLRAANCYLNLGEVEEALQYFKKCLQPGSDVCVDRKIMVEASEGIQNAQKVSECLNKSTKLLHLRTSIDAECALSTIYEALTISPHSESLLEMKAVTLFLLRKYEEVIQLCEQSVVFAKINCPSVRDDVHSSNTDRSFMLWRFSLIFKSYFYLGKLEEALGLLEKQVELRNEIKALESSIPLAITRELLRHKAAGNEAFQSGRHTEAIEHYTAALSCNVESRPFAAICFCNRAAAYKALNQIVDAIADCSLAIALDQNYLKALSRRASLYEMIRDYGQATNDLERLVSFQTKLVDKKTNQSVISSSANDLRQAQLRLLEVEGEARKDIPLNMYLILGIEPSLSSAAEIKKAYRKAALRHHPDKAGQSLAKSDNGDDGIWREIAEGVHKDADRLFKMIGEAYAVLSNPIKRARYDLEEEMRTSQKKGNVSSTSRTHADAQNYPSERTSSSRPHWTDVRKSYRHS